MEKITIEDLKEGCSVYDKERRIIAKFIKKINAKNMLCIGTCTGYTVAKLNKTFKNLKIDTIDYIPKSDISLCVVEINDKDKFKEWCNEEHDNWRGLPKEYLKKLDSKFRKYLRDNNIKNIKLYTEGSDEFFKNNKKNYDLIFIDGDHFYEVSKRDFNNSLKIINSPGVIIMHDIKINPNCKFWGNPQNTCTGVFLEYKGKKIYIPHTINGLGIIIK